MRMINRKVFYDEVRRLLFGGRLTVGQFKAMEAILNAWDDIEAERKKGGLPPGDLRHLAYPLATTRHEAGIGMWPVKEIGGASKSYGRTGYYGRGFVQITHKANYERAKQELGVDFVNNPDLALDPKWAAKIMFLGMFEGWFRGDSGGRHTLKRYFSNHADNPVGAREIINGVERKGGGRTVAHDIARYYENFLFALKKAAASMPAVTPFPVPKEPDVPADVNLPDSKNPGKTARIQGLGLVVVSVIAMWLVRRFGLDNAVATTTAEMIWLGLAQNLPDIGALVGSAWSAWGQLRANQPIKGSPLATEIEVAKAEIERLKREALNKPAIVDEPSTTPAVISVTDKAEVMVTEAQRVAADFEATVASAVRMAEILQPLIKAAAAMKGRTTVVSGDDLN